MSQGAPISPGAPATGSREQKSRAVRPAVLKLRKSRRARAIDRVESLDKALLRAGQTLFSRHPIDAVAINDIVHIAGVAKGSFYKYFPSKAALLAAVARQIRSRIERGVATANLGVSDPARRIARLICIYVRFTVQEPEQSGVLACNDRSGHSLPPKLNKAATDDLTAGLVQGRFDIPTVEAGSLLIIGVAHAGLVRFKGDRAGATNVQVAQQLVQLALRGLGVTPRDADLIAAQETEEIVGPTDRLHD